MSFQIHFLPLPHLLASVCWRVWRKATRRRPLCPAAGNPRPPGAGWLMAGPPRPHVCRNQSPARDPWLERMTAFEGQEETKPSQGPFGKGRMDAGHSPAAPDGALHGEVRASVKVLVVLVCQFNHSAQRSCRDNTGFPETSNYG